MRGITHTIRASNRLLERAGRPTMELLERHAPEETSMSHRLPRSSGMTRRTLLAAAGSVAAFGPARAQGTYPARPIRLVIPYPAGGPLDVIYRRLGEVMVPTLGQTFVIDNRPGANGTIGSYEVATSTPDGHTLLAVSSDAFENVYGVLKKVPYDSVRDFEPIAQVFGYGAALIVRADNPAHNFAELMSWIKGRNGAASFSSWGPGSYAHLIGEAVAHHAGAAMIHTVYKGTVPGLQDLLAGVLDIHYQAPSPAIVDMVHNGKLRLLAVTGDKRLETVPDVPTFAEQGMPDPIVKMLVWCGVAAPARTPKAVVDKLNQAIVAGMQTPPMVKILKDFNFAPMANTPAEFAANLKRELPITLGLIKTAGIVPQ
jgi:tripartite-type tricarboxylate transporter receptor subunit TctC